MYDIIVMQNQFGTKAIHRFQCPTADKEELFDALNGYGDFAAYRNRITHSLTARDAISIDGVWYMCESFGWSEMKFAAVMDMRREILSGAWR